MRMKNTFLVFILLLLSSCAFTKKMPEVSIPKVRVNVTMATTPQMITPLTKQHLQVALQKLPHVSVQLISWG